MEYEELKSSNKANKNYRCTESELLTLCAHSRV